MMTSQDIRQTFLNFFAEQEHKIVPSAPMVNKNDPTLMFTNAGMNQFKDYFLGNQRAPSSRIADTQKCLRVSGKHNDLEEVGLDGYHHTMFEMLGNWSFGDYFKEEAIAWAWKLLTDVYKIDKDRLYVSVFAGDDSDNLPEDIDAADIWKKWISEDRILRFSKKDNFWEMGDSGPCGPCSEIHVDLRDDASRSLTDGRTLVNNDHPDVIEIWNLVFIEFNRKADGSLESLPQKHIDTGMGFERLVRVVQKAGSNYETDVFLPYIHALETLTRKKYTASYDPSNKTDIAFRVVSDHLRAVSFAIADGQLPSNTGAGYVIRRILRRAIRYYYTFLEYPEPLMYNLVAVMARQFKGIFPEMEAQQDLIASVIKEEERSFLRTLDSGLKRLSRLQPENGVLSGEDVFELYDTYGFPLDLTRLIASENGWLVDEPGFQESLLKQKERSRSDARKAFGDWHTLSEHAAVQFIGYDHDETEEARILKYRTVEQKGKSHFHIVLDKTPFYAEGGGQVGDTGYLSTHHEKITVLQTYRENDLIVHEVDRLPEKPHAVFQASIDVERRRKVESNHSATHLLHAALRTVLGTHVQQKGSLVHPDYLRFDFSHFQKVSDEELHKIENLVNAYIRKNVPKGDYRDMLIEDARNAGAMMLFGEKYGDKVRMISFDPAFSTELCGGCHVPFTGNIGLFKMVSESAVAAGVRRIEAVTGLAAESFVRGHQQELQKVQELLKSPADISKAILDLQEEVKELRKELDAYMLEKAATIKVSLFEYRKVVGNNWFVCAQVELNDVKAIKNLAYDLGNMGGSHVVVLGSVVADKPSITILVSKDLVEKGIHAGNLVKVSAPYIHGGGGGQAFFATAGGSHAAGLREALDFLHEELNRILNV
jgi:alanyl-tRNA synthetase